MSATPEQLKPKEITLLIDQASLGDDVALNQLIPIIYPDLKQIASSMRHKHLVVSHTLNTTALVNEAWLKLKKYGIKAESRKHFFCICAKAMRHIIMNKATEKLTKKRDAQVVPLDDNDSTDESSAQWMLQLDHILKSLENSNKRLTEVFQLKYFLGFTEPDIAEILTVSDRTVRRDWITVKKIINEIIK